MLKNDYVRPSVVCLAVSLFMASVASAVPTNGDFSIPDLSGWTVESGTVTDGGGYAIFEEDPVYLMSSLSQQFTLPAGALELSFERTMEVEGSGEPTTDSFAVSLFDTGYNPPISYEPGVTWFYYIDTTPDSDLMVPGASLIGDRVTLDVSSYAGMDVLLAFDFFSEDDGVITRVLLDNVHVYVIPAPAALLLAAFGSGLVGLLRRSRHGLISHRRERGDRREKNKI